MTNQELIEQLSKRDPFEDVMILDGFNGGGAPRNINLGPTKHVVSPRDAEAAVDCEDIIGQAVTIIGFGCY